MSDMLSIRNPRSGECDYEIAVTSPEAIAETTANLRLNQPKWLQAGIEKRIDALRAWQVALNTHSDEIVAALATDTGRHAIAYGEFAGLHSMIDRWCQKAPSLAAGQVNASAAMPSVEIQQQLSPFPLAGAISPWNFPLLLSFIDAVPALLAGSAAIIKPSEVTPRFAKPVIQSIQDTPLLRDVLTLISGDGRTGAALVQHVDVVAFTGSVATGRKVAAAAADAFIPAFLELGGKDPAILLENSPLERAATAILRASTAATGQACQSLERIYVNEAQHDEFVALLTEKAAAIELSYPDPHSGITGPLIFAEQANIIERHLRDAVQKGATVHTGGEILSHGGGAWIAPTVISNVDHDMLIMTEETFGPVMPVMRFGTSEEGLALANDSHYGLSGAVFAGNEANAIAIAEQLNVGGVSVNDAGMTTMIFESPKSAFNLSGLGPSRMGDSGMTRFYRQKSLYVNRGDVIPLESMAENSP